MFYFCHSQSQRPIVTDRKSNGYADAKSNGKEWGCNKYMSVVIKINSRVSQTPHVFLRATNTDDENLKD